MAYTWQETGRRFINPYNFVGLGGDVERSEVADGTLSGRIRVSLIVKTPLAVPDAESARTAPDVAEHRIYDFYRVSGKPVIPGSQLRGMIRSAYEAVNNNNILSAHHSSIGNPGLIRYNNDGYHLYKAKSYKDFGRDINKNEEVRRTWYNIKGEKLKSIILKNTNEEIGCINLDRAIENYNENINIYDADGSYFDKYKSRISYGIGKDPGTFYPVFYETVEYENKTYVYLEPVYIGRFVFDKRLDDLLDTHKSCSVFGSGTLCKACSMFGMIANDKSYASRLRFSDAEALSFDSVKNVTLRELSSPKITSVEFYTERPKYKVGETEQYAKYWTYDYRIIGYKKNKNPNGDEKSASRIPDSIKEKDDIKIRGRKFYVHNPNLKESDYNTAEKTKRNSTMELCKPESRFSFCIYFERITKEQLHELVWTICIGENDENGNQMHKLGHGKPLGLGSVKLVVDGIELRRFDRESLTYEVENADAEKYTAENPFDSESSYFREFMTITNFMGLQKIMQKKKADICYPLADDCQNKTNSKSSHQWFAANRELGEDEKGIKGTGMAWNVKYRLPKITSNNPTLPEYKKDKYIEPKKK